jgi:hypothetical protein
MLSLIIVASSFSIEDLFIAIVFFGHSLTVAAYDCISRYLSMIIRDLILLYKCILLWTQVPQQHFRAAGVL